MGALLFHIIGAIGQCRAAIQGGTAGGHSVPACLGARIRRCGQVRHGTARGQGLLVLADLFYGDRQTGRTFYTRHCLACVIGTAVRQGRGGLQGGAARCRSVPLYIGTRYL